MRGFIFATLAVVGSGYGIATYLRERQEVDVAVEASRAGLVAVRAPAGRVAVETHDRPSVTVTGRADFDPEMLRVTTTDRQTTIEVPDGAGRKVDLVVRVPRQSAVDVRVAEAAVAVRDVEGFVFARSESGDVDVRGSPEGVLARSVTGDITLATGSASGFAYSRDGDVRLDGASRDRITVDREGLDRWEERWNWRYDRKPRGEWDGLRQRVGDLIGQVMAAVQVDGDVDFEPRDHGFSLDLSANVDWDAEDLETLEKELQAFMEDLDEHLSEGMEVLSDELRELSEDLREAARDRRRR